MRFKIGDRVINTIATTFVPEGMTGTVAEEDFCPWVKWDNGEVWCRNEDYLERVNEVIDNYGLWKRHDALREEQAEIYAKLNKALDIAIEGVEKALNVLEDDFDKGCEMLENLILRLEDER